MRYQICFALFGLMMATPGFAQNIRKMSDAEQLGMTAGAALACGATKKLEDFELIASRLLANPAPTEDAEKRTARIYMQAKWEAMEHQRKDTPINCNELLAQFNALPLFNSIVYADGSVKLPDGTWSRPLRPVKKR